MKFILSAFILTLLSAAGFSQELSIQGKITDKKTGTGLPSANVVLVHLPDSVIKGTAASKNGAFELVSLKRGRYLLKVTYIGYESITRPITLADKPLNLGTIAMEETGVQVGEVQIEAKSIPAEVKEDTTEFSARAFKTNPDATAEDLVAKLPGVTVEQGTVKAQGEDVKKVLVDNKPFFGEDPATVLKNIPADMIERIQIYDRASEQAQFTGFSDGNEAKTINIITRMRTGQFGKFYAGYGAESEYRAGGNMNFFNEDRRISLLGLSNNINEQNFSSEDLLGVTSSSGGGGMFRRMASSMGGGPPGGGQFFRGGGRPGGGDAGNFMVDTRNGLATTHAAGANYTDKWGGVVDVTGSYFFNLGDNDANTQTFRQYTAAEGEDGQTYSDVTLNSSRNINHRVNFRFDYQIDSTNSILVQPRFSMQENNGTSSVNGVTSILGQQLNSTSTGINSDLLGWNFNNEILYRHRFETRGRTISFNATTGFNNNSGDKFQISQFTAAGVTDSLDQYSDLNRDGRTLSSNITYTEPFGEEHQLQVTAGASLSTNESDRKTYNAVAPDVYTGLDTAYSNTFTSDYLTTSAGLTYRFESKEAQFGAGASFQRATLENDQQFPFQGTLSRSFTNVLPNAMMMLRFSQTDNLRAWYRTRTNAPSVDQLQDVVDNTNPLQLSSGNPNLRQDMTHSFGGRYMSADLMNARYSFIFLGGNFTSNYIGKSTITTRNDTVVNGSLLVPAGGQYSQPVNLDGYFNLRTFFTYGFRWDLVSSNMNLNGGIILNRVPSLINGATNEALTPTLTGGAVLSSNISQELDFSLSSQVSYSYVKNSIQEQLNNEYTTINSRVRFNWIFWEGFLINTDLTHTVYSGLSSAYDNSYILWNIGFGKKFLPNDAGELRVTLYDALNQNDNIQRNITEIYTEDTRSNALQRYVLLTFTYNLRMIGGGDRPAGDGPPRDFGRPGR